MLISSTRGQYFGHLAISPLTIFRTAFESEIETLLDHEADLSLDVVMEAKIELQTNIPCPGNPPFNFVYRCGMGPIVLPFSSGSRCPFGSSSERKQFFALFQS